ncbi:hypothetical protein ABPG75_005853 [Micractinium tetrahymenae]
MGGVRQCAILITAFCFPPLAVMIVRDELDTYFWLNLLLTLLGWLPGMIHAIWILFNRNPLAEMDAWGYGPLTRPAAIV